jgi:hypothetical protein
MLAGHPGLSADIAPEFKRSAVFDPCSARGFDGMQTSVRDILTRAGAEIVPLDERNRCCGYGGHMRVANPSLYDEIVGARAAMSDAPYVVYCANCRETFASYGKRSAHILDIALGLIPPEHPPSISERRNNALALSHEFAGGDSAGATRPSSPDWSGLSLVMDDSLRESIDRRLISEDDVRECIYRAELNGDFFESPAGGPRSDGEDDDASVRLCCLERTVLTYWTLYTPLSPGVYRVLDAYYHRMRLESGDQA